MCGVSIAHTRSLRAGVEEFGLVEVERRRPAAVHLPNVWHLCDPPRPADAATVAGTDGHTHARDPCLRKKEERRRTLRASLRSRKARRRSPDAGQTLVAYFVDESRRASDSEPPRRVTGHVARASARCSARGSRPTGSAPAIDRCCSNVDQPFDAAVARPRGRLAAAPKPRRDGSGRRARCSPTGLADQRSVAGMTIGEAKALTAKLIGAYQAQRADRPGDGEGVPRTGCNRSRATTGRRGDRRSARQRASSAALGRDLIERYTPTTSATRSGCSSWRCRPPRRRRRETSAREGMARQGRR